MSTASSGVVVGYDPGGKGAHGLALLVVHAGQARALSTRTVGTTEEAVAFVDGLTDVIALGVDTLTCWGTGPGGWRPADRWLRERYKPVANSVVPPNYLSGSMVINGMAFLLAIQHKRRNIFATETHPKVLLFHLAETKYDYVGLKQPMDGTLSRALGVPVAPTNAHEWDAALSAYAALKGFTAAWKRDLHTLPAAPDERIVCPYGPTHYSWPD